MECGKSQQDIIPKSNDFFQDNRSQCDFARNSQSTSPFLRQYNSPEPPESACIFSIFLNPLPIQPETSKIFAQPTGIVLYLFLRSGILKQPPSRLGKRTRIPANSEHIRQLYTVEMVNLLYLLFIEIAFENVEMCLYANSQVRRCTAPHCLLTDRLETSKTGTPFQSRSCNLRY